jgi:hypothetical protein
MQEFLRQILDALIAHWAKILLPLLGIVFGAWWGKRRARREWARRQFLNRINVSLNLFEDGYLRLRTLSEKNLERVLNFEQAAAVQLAWQGSLTQAT